MDLRFFAIQDWRESGDVVMSHIAGILNPSDDLTKLLVGFSTPGTVVGSWDTTVNAPHFFDGYYFFFPKLFFLPFVFPLNPFPLSIYWNRILQSRGVLFSVTH
jgi:hypothetical protein